MHNSRGSYSAPLDDDPDRRVSRSWRLNDKIPARLVLYFLSWSGFLVSFMMRNDMNFALVAMISNENFTHNQFHNGSQAVLAGGTKDQLSIVKSIIISSFYWCYVLSQVAGGIATELFGTNGDIYNCILCRSNGQYN
ncbi:vesicular glutamate transporter 1 isoform X3 [Drosophila ficusphila]|uniref:vesicular glutamate transporter 1 isoform X3 n=1 Tax=Drosophila ficusphila TaxID=30025 RepID=UPI001C8989C6|nr:vesicular glutamate transporter 1 isoform X3 [Drosophila ficusphila]